MAVIQPGNTSQTKLQITVNIPSTKADAQPARIKYVKESSFCKQNTCIQSQYAIPLQRVFHGIDLRLIRLVVERQSIFLCQLF